MPSVAATPTTKSLNGWHIGTDLMDSLNASRPAVETWKERLERSEREAAKRRAARVAELEAIGIECFRCEDTGYVNGVPCIRCEKGRAEGVRMLSQEHARHIANIPAGIGIPPRFRGYELDTFPDQKSTALAAVRRWLASKRDPMKSGLLIYGGFGRGKTGLILGVMRELAWQHFVQIGDDGYPELRMPDEQQGYTQYEQLSRWDYDPGFWRFAQFTTATGLLESLRPKPDGDENDVMDRYLTVTYLAIDDLGSERLTEWGADRLFEIVNERHNNLRPLIVSSNLTPDGLAKRINRQLGDQSGDRIVERIIESCTAIAISDNAPNWRLTPVKHSSSTRQAASNGARR